MTIVVSPLSGVKPAYARYRPSHVVSLMSPKSPWPRFGDLDRGRHLRLAFHDIIAPREHLRPPDRETVEKLLTFATAWDASAPLLLHCWAGISRSTAAAYVIACARWPQASEFALAEKLRRVAPSATPNALIVALADEALQRAGRMTKAITAIGRGCDAAEGQVFEFPTIS